MPEEPVLERILRALAAEALDQLRLAADIEHPGESGRAREQILTQFIKRLIPSSFGVSTGFVVDAVGGKSKQLDVVVYRTDYAPVLDIGGVKHFLIESVVAVIEVKASITSWKRLEEALENIRSVKALDRTNRGRNYRLMEDQRVHDALGGNVDREEFTHQVFGVIVTERSLASAKLADYLLGWLRAHERREWPNAYVDANSLVVSYIYPKSDPDQAFDHFGTVTTRATDLAMLKLEEPGVPLVQLAYELVNWFRVVPKIDFRASDYLLPGEYRVDRWPI